MGITQREHDLLVSMFKEYVDSQVQELRTETERAMTAIDGWANRVEQRLDHPALVVDYRTWLIDTALAVGITPAEYIKRRKEVETQIAQYEAAQRHEAARAAAEAVEGDDADEEGGQ